MSIERYKTKSGQRYRAIVRIRKKKIQKTFKRKFDAEEWKREILNLHSNNKSQVLQHRNATLSELCMYWFENHSKVNKTVSSQTRDLGHINNDIIPYLGDQLIQELKPKDIEFWMNSLRTNRKLHAKTVNNALGVLSKILTDGARWEWLIANPARDVQRLKIPEADFNIWNREEIYKVLEHLHIHNTDFYHVIFIALNTGMRLGELKALKWDAIDLSQCGIRVKRSYCSKSKKVVEHTKGKTIRLVPINNDLQTLLTKLQNSNQKDEFVLSDFNSEHVSRDLRKICELIGIRSIRFHDIRHTFASHMMMNGANIYDLQKILGHSSIKTTEQYSHFSPEYLEGKTNNLGFGIETNHENVIALRKR